MRLRTIGLFSTLFFAPLAGPLPAEAQQAGKIPCIGYLHIRAGRAWLVFACLILCIQLITGCAVQVAPVDDQTIIEAFPFLRNGQTKKQEVLDGLGVPGNQYEEGRIITYQVGKDRSGRWSVGIFRPGYSLVLIFRMDEVLERHSLVRIMTNPSF